MQRSGYLFLLKGDGLQKTHNSHFQMEVDINSTQLDTGFKNVRYICQRIQTKALGNKIGSSWVWHRGLHAAHVILIPFVQLHTTHTKNITGVQICLFGIYIGVTCTLLHVHTKIHVYGISHSGEWPIIFFDARNLNLRAPLIYNLVCPYSLTTSCHIEGQE